MSDQPISGTAGSVTVGGTVVGEIAEWSFDISHNPVEATAFGAAWGKFVGSLQGATGSFSGNLDRTDAMQSALLAAYETGAEVQVALWLDATARFETAALLTGISEGVTVGGADTVLWDFQAAQGVSFTIPRLWLLEDGDNVLWQDGTSAYLTI